MSGSIQAEKLFSAIEEASLMVGAAFSREKVGAILDAYSDVLTDGPVIFSAQTESGGIGELEFTVQVAAGPAGPYAPALAHGFLERTDHPVGALLSDLQARVPIDDYLIDCGVTDGFKKVYAQFPRNLQKLSQLAELPSAPRALADNADLFARHGLEQAALIGINYRRRSMNVYFQLPADVAGNLPEPTVRSLLREIGVADPDRRMLAYACTAYRAYATVGWDSAAIQKLSFAPMPSPGLDPAVLPSWPGPELERFLLTAPHTYAGERINASAVKWSAAGDHLDLAVYHQISPLLLEVFTANARRSAGLR